MLFEATVDEELLFAEIILNGTEVIKWKQHFSILI